MAIERTLSNKSRLVVDETQQEVEIISSTEVVDVDETGSMASLDYRTLANKPSINEVTLVGDKSLEDIGVDRITNQDIWNIVGRRR